MPPECRRSFLFAIPHSRELTQAGDGHRLRPVYSRGMTRPLTHSEIAGLPPGLVAAVDVAAVEMVAAHHPLSHLSKLFRGYHVILVRGRRVFWPGLPADLGGHALQMSVLGHELVHVWQYAHGMTLWRYILRDVFGQLGRYDYRPEPGKPYTAYGYEQQAAMLEDWMRLRSGHSPRHGPPGIDTATLEAIVPFL